MKLLIVCLVVLACWMGSISSQANNFDVNCSYSCGAVYRSQSLLSQCMSNCRQYGRCGFSFVYGQKSISSCVDGLPIVCNGVSKRDPSVCSGNGYCNLGGFSLNGTCNCKAGYAGVNCQLTSCFGKSGEAANVCSGNGQCVGPDTCVCNEGFDGEDCSTPIHSCYGYFANDVNVCSGRGVCVESDECACELGWTGHICTLPQKLSPQCKDTTV